MMMKLAKSETVLKSYRNLMSSLREEEKTSQLSTIYNQQMMALISLEAEIKKKVTFDEILEIVTRMHQSVTSQE
jgi:hypothetical protein